jgi:thioredoxin-related protein
MKILSALFCTALLSLPALQLTAQQAKSSYNTPSTFSQGYIDWCDTYSESVNKAKASSKPLLILFTGSGWCPACMKLEKEVLGKPEFVQGVGGQFIFYKAEFNDPSPQGLAATPDSVLLDRYKVNSFPTIVVIDGSGKQLFTLGYKPGGPGVYVSELTEKLRTVKSFQPQNSY